MSRRVLKKKYKIAVLISGGGSNLQALIDAKKNRYFKSDISLVVSNKVDAYGLKRAKNSGIKTALVENDAELSEVLEKNEIDLIILAGYLKIIGESILNKYDGKIINIHPSLLPKYGGKGMYGIKVHDAVLNDFQRESGATVHYVNQIVDGGGIIIQKKVEISDCTTSEEIQQRVLEIEHCILKQAVKMLEEKN